MDWLWIQRCVSFLWKTWPCYTQPRRTLTSNGSGSTGIHIYLKVTSHLPTPVLDVCVEGEGRHAGVRERQISSSLSLERRKENRASSLKGGLIMLQQLLQIGIEEAMGGSRCILSSFTRSRLIFLCTKYRPQNFHLKICHIMWSHIFQTFWLN